MRIGEYVARTSARLAERGIPDATIEAEVLVRHVLRMDRAELYSASRDSLGRRQEHHVDRLVRTRLAREPLAYIVGQREFFGLDFLVNRHVLIPRQETELLVDNVLEFAASRPGQRLRVADVGTGSGAIAIAVACNVRRATVYASDVSRAALRVADVNRRRHRVQERVHLWQGDLLRPVCAGVDVVISNPPYIGSREIADLAPEVGLEPGLALNGGEGGLEITARLLSQVGACLVPGGRLIVEIAPEQLDDVVQMAGEAIPGASVSYARDALGLPRAVIADRGR